MASIGKIARRTFLIGSTAIVGGVVFGAYYVSRPAPNPLKPGPGEAALNPFVLIDQQGVTLFAPRAEMGQGVMTTWAALIAEELDVELDQVRVLHGPAAVAYYNTALMGEALPGKGYDQSDFMHGLAETLGVVGKLIGAQVTGGSTSMVDGFVRMREAGAAARETLKEAAAKRLGVPRDRLSTKAAKVIAPDGTEIAYTELAEEAARLDPVEGALRSPSDWRLLGRNQPRLDMVGKSTGTAEFGIDVRLPGMKFASLRMSPRLGGGMKSFDDSAAIAMPGVEQVVDLGTGVAVVANNTWLAMQALDAIAIEWEDAPYPPESEQIFETIAAAFEGEANSTLRDDGDISAVPAGSTIVEAEYRIPYLAHATMEPMNATALFTGDRLQVWSGNQAPVFVQNHCATAVGLEPEQVEIHTTYMGGGFGRRGEVDFSVLAARVARELEGVPVQVTWSREEDMRHDFYRPGAIARFRGAMQDGKAIMVDGSIAAQSCAQQGVDRWLGLPAAGPDKATVDAAYNAPYAIPNFRVRGYLAEMAIPVGFWRSVGASMNGFFFDTFIDEMANAAGQDPLVFRLELARAEWAPAAAVLEAVRDMSGWTGKTPEGVGRGVGFTYSFGTPVAQVVEVVAEDAGIRIARAWIAADVGLALDPGTVEAQLVSGMIYGLSAACFGKITFSDGEVEQMNFPDYDAIRMHNTPTFDVRILETKNRLSGVGEPGTPPAMPALGNALFDLTGKRVRSLPMSEHFDLLT